MSSQLAMFSVVGGEPLGAEVRRSEVFAQGCLSKAVIREHWGREDIATEPAVPRAAVSRSFCVPFVGLLSQGKPAPARRGALAPSPHVVLCARPCEPVESIEFQRTLTKHLGLGGHWQVRGQGNVAHTDALPPS